MNITSAWRPVGRCLLDGEPFLMEVLEAPGGYQVRICFEGQPPVADEHVWPTLEEARGRGYQMADEVVVRSLS